MRSLSREMYRYTFYALAAMKVGSALIQVGIGRGLVRAATQGQDALDRLAAASLEARTRIGEISRAASDLATKLPFAFGEIVRGIELMIRAGLSLDAAQQAIGEAGKLAVISGRSIAAEAEFLAVILSSFGQSLGEGGAAAAVDQLAAAARLSRYWIDDLEDALANCMATASAMNQSLATTLTVLAAMGRKGMSAAQAGTLLNRTLAMMGNERVIAFFEGAMEAYSTLTGLPAPAVFTATGLGDIGEIMVAAAEALQLILKDIPEAMRPEAWRAIYTELAAVFGVRGIRQFLALAEIQFEDMAGNVYSGLEAYRRMLAFVRGETEGVTEATKEATGAADDYMKTIYGSWYYTRAFLRNMFQQVQINLGMPIIRVLNPVARLLGEVGAAFATVTRGTNETSKSVTQFISVMFSAVAAISAIGAAILLVNGIMMIWKGRLMDIGSSLQESLKAALGRGTVDLTTLVSGKYTVGTLLGMPPQKAGMALVLGSTLTPLAMIARIVVMIAAGFLIWKRNLGGVQERLRPIIEWFQGLLAGQRGLVRPGERGESWGKRLEAVLSGQTPFGAFILGIVRGAESFLRIFSSTVSFLITVAQGMWRATAPLRAVIRGFIRGAAWLAGLGNVERGFENLGRIIGFMAAFAAAKWVVTGGVGIVRRLIWLFGKFQESRFIVDLLGGGAFFRTLGQGFIRLAEFAAKRLGRADIAETLTKVGRVLGGQNLKAWADRISRAFIKWIIGMFQALRAGGLPAVWALFTGALRSGWVLLGKFVGGVWLALGALYKLAAAIYMHVVPSIISAARKFLLWAGASMAAGLGQMAAGWGGLLAGGAASAGLGAVLLGLGKFILPALLAAAVIAGIAFLIKSLVDAFRGSRQTATAAPAPAMALSSVPVVSEQHVSIAPTIYLPQGTPREHAEQVIAILNAEFPVRFKEEMAKGLLASNENKRRLGVAQYMTTIRS